MSLQLKKENQEARTDEEVDADILPSASQNAKEWRTLDGCEDLQCLSTWLCQLLHAWKLGDSA